MSQLQRTFYNVKYRMSIFDTWMKNDGYGLTEADGTLSISAYSGSEAFREAEDILDKLKETLGADDWEIYGLSECIDIDKE